MKYLLVFLFLINNVALAQERSQGIRLPEPKRFIDKVEVFAGPGLSFNYGNKFVENYKDDNIQNKRLLKAGYTFGVGVYHPISNRIEINARLQYEQKGSKTEINTPVGSDFREMDLKDYSYNYLTLLLAPQIVIGKEKRIFFLLGGYYSKIKRINGYGRTYNTLDHRTDEGRFKGRFFKDLRSDGGVYSVTWIPGLQSFESDDYGVTLTFGYSIRMKEKRSLTIQVVDNFGLRNINKDNPYGLKEKNHTVSLIVGYTIKRPRNKN